MGKLRSNKAVGDLQGKVGGLVYVHRADGVVIVRRAPERQAESSAPQKANESRFTRATLYVKRLKSVPEEYAPYKLAAKLTRKRACDLAIADFLKPPSVTDVDLSSSSGQAGESIWVEAVDDFGVKTVCLTITALNGTLLEDGEAILDDRASKWLYLTKSTVLPGETVVIHITATDRPGNAVTKTLHHAIPV